MKTDTSLASNGAFPPKCPSLDNDETLCNASAQTALLLAEITSEELNDDSNDDANVLRRDDDLSCFAAISMSALHNDNLIQKRERTMVGREWTENKFDGQKEMTRENNKAE